jgi:hypothetical protein
MQDADLDRRSLLTLLGGWTAAGLAGCAGAETPREGLARLFDLTGEEQAWLNALDDAEQRELYDLLSGGGAAASPRAVRLVAKLLGPRSHLFAFVRYPPARDERSVCDGLVRE